MHLKSRATCDLSPLLESAVHRPDIAYLVGLSLLPGIGPARFQRLLQHFGSAERAWHAPLAELGELGVDARMLPALAAKRRDLSLEHELSRLEKHGIQVLCLGDAAYPACLAEIPSPPHLLYMKGTLLRDDEQSIGVVGARKPTAYGADTTARLIPELVQSGLTIVSGLARGIDSIAHRAALDAGGRTIAVLGSGLDVIYPPENRALYERIAEQGAVLSEYPLGTKPDAFNFPARNRIISGLSLGVIVMEAQLKSGALITADFALEQNREVFALPGRITDRTSAGCNRLIREGRAKLITGVDDVLSELNLSAVLQQMEVKTMLPLSAEEQEILRCLSHDPVHVDDLARRTQLAPSVVTGALLMLELKGAVRQLGSMQYVLAH